MGICTRGIAILATLLVCADAASANVEHYQNSPQRRIVAERDWGPWLGPFRAQLVPSLMEDFGEKYLYASADKALPPPGAREKRVVFLGDSITDRWNLGLFFPDKPYVNRGIGSQVTAQMVLRFHQDVIDLKPSAVILLAGVNDVQGFLQQDDQAQIEENYEAMADMADRHGIRLVFSSILPVNNYEPKADKVVAERHPDELRALNAWLRDFSRERGYQYADYYSAMIDARGLMRKGLTDDGIHPTDNGYAIMAPIAEAAIERALSH
ncbi:GDSL family lipase [Nostoc sp. 3335mG]|nr:GDSL family lipase [Nostoc sp. 3335mG]